MRACIKLCAIAAFAVCVGCSGSSPDESTSESASSASTVTAGPWTGVYDFGPKDRNVVPRGTLRIVSQGPDKIIYTLEVLAETTASGGGWGRFYREGALDLTSPSHAGRQPTTVNDDFDTVPDARACWHELTRTASGDVAVSAHQCASQDGLDPMTFGPLVFRKRTAGGSASPYVGLYEELYLSSIARPGGSIRIDAVGPSGDVDLHLAYVRSSGKAGAPPFAAHGQLARGGLWVRVTDSSGCKGIIKLGAESVTLTFDFDAYPPEDSRPAYGLPCTATAAGPGTWWLGDFGNEYNASSFGDSASPLVDN
jgi:hypothetical protein